MGNSPIVVKQLNEKQQLEEQRKRYPENSAGPLTKNSSDWIILYLVTVTQKSPRAKKELEVNYSPRSNRWFVCPYDRTMDVIANGTDRPTKLQLEEEIKNNFNKCFE